MDIEGKKIMRKTSELLKDKKVILFSLIVFFQVGVEFSIVTWLAPFLRDVQSRSDLIVSFYLSFFFICFTVGRFLASIIVERLVIIIIYFLLGGWQQP